MSGATPVTTAELRAAFDRARVLHFYGWTFERAQAAPLVLWALTKSALAARRSNHLPAQPGLF